MVDQPDAGTPQVLYLEPDDEIPSVVRRLQEVHGSGPVIVVAPGRSKATSSAIGLRLLARRATEAGIPLRLVADAATRLMATEVGITAYATVADAQAGLPIANPEAPSRPRAAIHVVRGERTPLPSVTGPRAATGAAAPPFDAIRSDDTQAVPVVAPPPRPPRAAGMRPRLRWPTGRQGWLWAAGIVVLVVVLVAAVLPGATIHLVPDLRAVGPFAYPAQLPATADSGQLTSTLSASATGQHVETTAATGSVTFSNFNTVTVEVPAGTSVSAGDVAFGTDGRIIVPAGTLIYSNPNQIQIIPGMASVGATAATPGTDGNVAAGAIDTVDDKTTARRLRGFQNQPGRLVTNPDPMSGGSATSTPEVSQADVNQLVGRIQADLRSQLSAHLSASPGRFYAPATTDEQPQVSVPEGTVGTRGQATFKLTGTLDYSRRFVTREQVTQAAATKIHADAGAQPVGTLLVDATIAVSPSALAVSGEQITATLNVRASVAPVLDESELKARVAGRSRQDATDALSDIGVARVDLWPGWVDAVPRLPFRITISIEAPPSGASPSQSSAPVVLPSASP
jgi:hypothetical protein